MYGVVQLATSMRREEVDEIDGLTVRTGESRFRRAGTLRAMLRFVLAHREEFIRWFEETDGKPMMGGDDG